MVLLWAWLCVGLSAAAQEKRAEEKVYMSADQMPEFPGGQSAMLKFVTDNFRMLPGLPNEPLNGTMVASFVITPEGKVSQVEIVKKLSPTLDAEMVRVVSAMPTWKPGVHQGVPVAVRSSVPLKVAWKGLTPNNALANIINGHLQQEQPKLQATPEFPGGEKALWEYMKEKKASLEDAKQMKVAGVFEAEFMVSETGKVTDIRITRALHPDFSKAVRQAIEEMPAWKPAKQKGKAVPAIYSFAYEVKEGEK